MTKRKYIRIIEAAFLGGMWLLLALFFDYWYAMNDDVLIHGILSGQYSGMPNAHNISSHILLNWAFVLLYRLCSFVPWFGVFVVSAQFCSLYGILMCLERRLEVNLPILSGTSAEGGHRGTKMKLQPPWRYAFFAIGNLLLMGLMLQELVVVQYTYTAALLMTSATLQLSCMEDEDARSHRGFWPYFGILMQYLLVFCLRAEIGLFLLPFSAAMHIICYHKRNGLRVVGWKLKRLGLFWGILLLCIAGLHRAEGLGYGSNGWADYRKIDQYRTQLYDFLSLPEYQENQAFYQEAGISEVQYELLKNYNFSLDEAITSDTLQRVVDYANEKRISQYTGLEKMYMRFFTLTLREGIWSYTHRIMFAPEVSAGDYPWNLVCAALYLTLLLLTCVTKRAWNLVYLLLLFAVRSVLWMYIILRQRMPERVTHSLFIIEIVCLLALIFEEMSFLHTERMGGKVKWLSAGMALVFFCGAGAVTINNGISLSQSYGNRESLNAQWQELLEYCAQREDCFYFMDVYSTVNYSEKIFAQTGSAVENYDICGGWLAKSPLCEEKYENFGFTTPRKALIENSNVFFIAEQGNDLDWLIGLYEEYGITIKLEYLEKVAGQFDIISLEVVPQASAKESPLFK